VSWYISYLLFFAGAFVFGYIINKVMLGFAHTLGIRKNYHEIIRWNDTTKPSLGGICFFIVFLLSIAAVPIFENNISNIYSVKHIALIFGASLSFIMGLADDAYNTRPFLKFITQIVCGLVLVFADIQINFFNHELLDGFLTVFWVVAMMNSLNMLDNMDAITTVTSISIVVFMIFSYLIQHTQDAFLLVILIGILAALLSFIPFNKYPSKMYMGDTGSQFLGFIISAISILLIWNTKFKGGILSSSAGFILVLTVFVMPIVDTTMVSITRIARGSSPFVGGKDHTTHRLSYLKFSDNQVAFIVAFIQLVAIVIAIFTLIHQTTVWLYVCSAYFLVILTLFSIITRKTKPLVANE
jgi:UDP-GlcNAc:undecaprenyl-phosphate GlcNAc-1-phosphate transferase